MIACNYSCSYTKLITDIFQPCYNLYENENSFKEMLRLQKTPRILVNSKVNFKHLPTYIISNFRTFSNMHNFKIEFIRSKRVVNTLNGT